MKCLGWLSVVILATSIGACQAFGGLGDLQFTGKTSAGGGGQGGNGSSSDPNGGAGSMATSGTLGTGGVAMTTGTVAMTTSSSSITSSSSGGNGLDPDLSVPTGGAACTNYGNEGGPCGNLEVCRISSKHGGRCEGTTDPHELGGPCTTGEDCDILFECYKNKCTNFCILGTEQCGNHCIDVGNDTEGVCWPVP